MTDKERVIFWNIHYYYLLLLYFLFIVLFEFKI